MYTEQDLSRLIDEKLVSCEDSPNVCQLMQTEEGRRRVKQRVQELIFNDGITDVDACIAQIESELLFTE
jgi:hypothetical protein